MKNLITAYERRCDECLGKGQRLDEKQDCPSCEGSGYQPVGHVVDGALYKLFPGSMLEVEKDSHAENILVHKAYQGVIEVKGVRQGNSILFDVDGALLTSKEHIRRADEQSVAEYIRIQQEGPMAAGRPAQMPFGRYAEAIERLDINLESFGIRPPGYGLSKALAEKDSRREAVENERDRMALEIQQLGAQLAAMTTTLNQILAERNAQVNAAPANAQAVAAGGDGGAARGKGKGHQ